MRLTSDARVPRLALNSIQSSFEATISYISLSNPFQSGLSSHAFSIQSMAFTLTSRAESLSSSPSPEVHDNRRRRTCHLTAGEAIKLIVNRRMGIHTTIDDVTRGLSRIVG
ncbi:hypothetical protein TNCV_1814861 [Trichonephila clavipes]|nr:hypothetical protein TNCV_1814861 [Trichonephila clavipes]